jgi:7,8-dihydropterin-6-yl-methyl-4-(beta-D-ribofuranosyl)aminobenzene 5'-phosphate synthase
LKITVVVDNNVPPGAKGPFRGEHGLSVLLETGVRKVLFDAGPSDIILHNLMLLGVHPKEIDAVVLSHGHYDHTGGLGALLTMAGKRMPVYSHPGVFQLRYSLTGGSCRYVGIPYTREYLTQIGADFQAVESPVELLPNLWISGAVPRETAYEEVDANMVIPNQECGCCETPEPYIKDQITDDMALYLRCAEGLMVLGGCAHSGIINMVNHGLKVTGSIKVHGLMGGTHLGPASEAQQNATLASLQWFAPNFVASNHCTGFAMMAKLSQVFEKKFIPAFCGTSIEC